MEPSSGSVTARHMLQMSGNPEPPVSVSPPVGVTALVVDPTTSDALTVVETLTECHIHASVADTFAKAKEFLLARPPSVLITEVRLAEYNGLHLVLRGKSVRPEMAALVTSSKADPVLQADAEGMGATFVLKPIVVRELAAAVLRTLFRPRRGDVAPPPIRPPFERRSAERRTTVVPHTERRIQERRWEVTSRLKLLSVSSGTTRPAGPR